ncbi:MAG TPA: hypothetical protein VLA37_09110, partial [Sphingomonadaceae bacterium]|nr:hypothetical protein [Sphingomonadaceae bacterium]
MTSALKVQALINWLVSGAPPQTDYSETVAELARRMVDAGVDADIIGLYQTPKNPLLGGRRFLWSADNGFRVREFTHADMESPRFVNGVVDVTRRAARPVRYRIGEWPEFDTHPGSKPLIDGGYSECAFVPLIAVNEANAVLAVGVKRNGGLADEQFGICRRIAAPLARVVESRVRYEGAASLLATFL